MPGPGPSAVGTQQFPNAYTVPGSGGLAAYVTPSGGDDSAAVQSAVTAGSLVYLGPGTFLWNTATVTFARSTPSKVWGSGMAVTKIQLSNAAPRAFDLLKVADYDTFNDIEICDLTVDCNNIAGGMHTIIGTQQNGPLQTRINLARMAVRRCMTINVPYTATVATEGRKGVVFAVAHPAASEGTQTTITDVTVEKCIFQGGNYGVWFGGLSNSGGNALNVFLDRFYIRDNFHDTGATVTNTAYSANFQAGSHAQMGYGEVTGNVGLRSGDDGIEIDQPDSCLIAGNVIADSWNTEFELRNLRAPQTTNGQTFTLRDCHARISLRNPDSGAVGTDGPGVGFQIGAATDPRLGTVILDGCSFWSNATNFSVTGSGLLASGTSVQHLIVNNSHFEHDSINYAPTATRFPRVIHMPLSTGAGGTVDFQNVTISIAGAITGANTVSPELLEIDGGTASNGRVNFNCNNVRLNATGFTIASGSGSITGIDIGLTTSVITPTLDNVTVEGSPTLWRGRVIRFGGTETLTIYGRGSVINSNFTALPNDGAAEIQFTATSNRANVYERNNRYRVWPVLPSAITVTASPFSYTNADGYQEQVDISGGTVTLVEISKNGGTNFTTLTGVLAGIFLLDNNDILRVTYTVAPTMQKFPVKH